MDLTAIDPLKLPSLPLEKKANLPDCPAIYFAISGSGEILYIGRTADLARRWISHHRKIVAMSNLSFLRIYTLFGKISGSFSLIISIFEPINRPY
ncbi:MULTISPECIES: GIY-YIG nuclease family protein [unclassified Nostoc]|uniref:GIY-YIG nuclease family protein n=1 Tax=unclassified Nostoc TaxID=2593658 RepID=UPI0025AA862B|nr:MULTISPECIES: GIY-YIG nuclease family protein [unclassified Nostoc]MDM9582835.1 GIY-YIG nuclease family protein [Nostoc sp. GT001]MDZ7946174.1 GIY-YIG nuclease family protein [Nostoc sp. EfeVER01]MDZ7992131.1 GIY-YIG nuclease family protein [Nostoc sp. EspVER01]